jgi:hypothetical protein
VVPFLQAISALGFRHVYYGASTPLHSNHFLRIRNGHAALWQKSFSKLDFNIPMSRVNPSVVGQ